MLIKMTYQIKPETDEVVVWLAFGKKAANSVAYNMASRTSFLLPTEEFEAFRNTMERGAKRGVTVIIEPAV